MLVESSTLAVESPKANEHRPRDSLSSATMPKRIDPFTVLVEQDEAGYYVATVPELRGCHTQAKSLDVLMRRVNEAIAICLADGLPL